jgi:hypothetical protein
MSFIGEKEREKFAILLRAIKISISVSSFFVGFDDNFDYGNLNSKKCKQPKMKKVSLSFYLQWSRGKRKN